MAKSKKGSGAQLKQLNARQAQARADKSKQAGQVTAPSMYWEEVWELRQAIVHQLLVFKEIGPMLRDPKLVAEIESPQQLANDIQLLAKDINKTESDILKAGEGFTDRTGLINDEDDRIECIRVFQELVVIQEMIEQTIRPTAQSIIYAIEQANQKLQKKEKEEKEFSDLQDVKKVSDVEFKEVSNDQ